MNAPVLLAQLAGSSPSTNTPPKTLKVEKPQNGQAVTVHLDGNSKLDFSDVASEKLTFVRNGDKLIVLFDNQATVTVEPVFDAAGHPRADVAFAMTADRTLSGDQFADLFPITTDQSVLPAAGPGGNGPTAGAHFGDATVDALSTGTPLDLLGAETLGAGFNALTGEEPNPTPIGGGIDVARINEDGLAGGNPDNGPGIITVGGPLNVDFGTDVIGRSFAFAADQPALTALTSDGQAVHLSVTTVGGIVTMVGFVGADASIAANQVFTVSLDATSINGSYNFTLLRPLDHPIAGTEDALDLSIHVIATDGSGNSAPTVIHVNVTDDVPLIVAANETHSTLTDPSSLAASTQGGSLGISWGSDRFNDHIDGGVSAVNGHTGDRSVVFSDALVTATGRTGDASGTIAALTSFGQTVHYALAGNGTVLIAYTGDTIPSLPGSGDQGDGVPSNLVFTVTLSDASNSGSYVITQYHPLDHDNGAQTFSSIDLSFHFTATDSDGDPASGTLTATVTDTAPVIGAIGGQTVIESTLSGDEPVPEVAARLKTVGGDNSFVTAATGAVSLNISWNADNNNLIDGPGPHDRSVAFSASLDHFASGLTSNGDAITYTLSDNGQLLTATAQSGDGPARIVFTVQLSDQDSGSYRFTLLDNLDHAAPASPGAVKNDLPISFGFTATDSDGDTASSTFTLHVTDDVPVVTAAADTGSVDESLIAAGPGHPVGQTQFTSGHLNVDWNADDKNDHLTFASTTITDGSGHALALSSGGVALDYTVRLASNGIDQELVAYKHGDPAGAGNPVFVVTLNALVDPAFAFSLFQTLDHPAAGTDTLSLNFTVNAFDGDGDSVQQSFAVNVADSVPTVSIAAGASLVEDETSGIQDGTGDAALTSAPALLPAGIISLARTDDGFVAIDGGADGVKSVALTNAAGAALSNIDSGLTTLDGTHILLSNDPSHANVVLGMAGSTLALAIFIDPATGAVSVADYVAIRHPVTTDPNDGVTMAGVVYATVTDGDNDHATTATALTVTIKDDGPSVGAPAATTALESDLTSHVSAATHGSLDVHFGTDGPAANLGAVYFSNQSSAIANIHAVDDQNHGVDLTHLTSQGQAVQFALIDPETLVGYTGAIAPTAITDANVVMSVVLSQNAGNPNGGYDFTLLKPLDDLPAPISDIKLTFDFTAKDGDGDTTPGHFDVTVHDTVPTIGTSSIGNVSEDKPLGLAGAPLAIDWGADSSHVAGADRSLVFASTTVTVTDPAGHAVALTSYGNDVQIGFIGGVLVGYTGTTAPTATGDAQVVFIASLSDVTGSYSFTLKQPLDHAAPVGGSDYLDLAFNITATDADGDAASGSFTVRVDAAGTIGSIDYTSETSGVFVNLGDADASSGGQIVHGHSATDLISGGGHIIGIDALGTITDASGGSAADVIVGGSGASIIHGNGGDDTIIYQAASGGRETVDGGSGTDTEIVNGTASPTTYNVNAITVGADTDIGINVVAGTGGASKAAATDVNYEVATHAVEQIVLNLGNGGDTVVVGGNLSGAGLAGSAITIHGGTGDDTVDLSLMSNQNVVFDGAGNGAGGDTVILGFAFNAAGTSYAPILDSGNHLIGVAITYLSANGPVTDTFTHVEHFQFADGTLSVGQIFPPTANPVTRTVADTATTDAGHVLASGNAITDVGDSDIDAGTTLSVTAVNGLSAGVGSDVVGSYGTLHLGFDGAYTYTANPALDALQAGQSPTDVFDFTVTDSNGGSTATKLTFTINGADDATIISGGPFSGIVTEAGGVDNASAGTPTVRIHFAVSDADDSVAISGGDGLYGSVSAENIVYSGPNAASFDLVYALDNSNATVQALAAGAILHDTFSAISHGVVQNVDITIVGANDAPVGVSDSQTLNETSAKDAGHVISGVASVLANDTDVDTGDTRAVSGIEALGGAGFAAVSGGGATIVHGNYGDLAINADGTYTYTPNAAFDALQAGDQRTDVFTYQVTDAGGLSGTANLTFTINGAKDPAVISGTTTGSVVEAGGADNIILGTPTAAGTLTDSDVDNSANTFQAVTTAAASINHYGTYTVDAAGNWTYNLDNGNAAVQALNIGGQLTDRFAVLTQDGTSQTITITINGSNDAAVITGTASGIVKEAGGVNNGDLQTPTATGTLTDTDVDNPANLFQAASGTSVNGYGSYTVDASGHWTFTLDNGNPAVDALNKLVLTDHFTVLTADGTAKVVTIGINGTNDAAVISGDINGAVTESGGVGNGTPGTATATGTLTDTDVDNAPNTFVAASFATASGYGSYQIDASGHWIYTLNNANATVEGLAAGQHLTDVFFVSTADFTSQKITITITGTNDAAVISGRTTGAVIEAGGVNNAVLGTATASGTLTDTDVDNPANTFQAVTTAISGANHYGTYTVDATGHWSYTLDNNNAAVQALNVGGQLTDSFAVLTADGTSQTVTVTINGTNDAAVISGQATGAVIEAGGVNNAVAGTATASGTLTDTDVDNPANIFQAVTTATAGINHYGTYTVDAAGHWSYTLDNNNAAVQALNVGGQLTDSFAVLTADGTSQTVTVTITGTNDAAVISGQTTGAVIEAGGVDNAIAGTATATGTLLDTDVDNPANIFQAVTLATASTGGYGTYTIDGSGHWTYSLDNSNPAVQALAGGQPLTDSFIVLAQDGTSQTVTIAITGANDAPVAVADSQTINDTSAKDAGRVIASTASVLANDTDVDAGDTRSVSGIEVLGGSSFAAVSAANATIVHGTYGDLAINADGTYNYTPNAAFDALQAGDHKTDVFTYQVTDAAGLSSTASLTIAITGANDAPVGVADSQTLNDTSAQDAGRAINGAASVLANDTDVDTGDTRSVSGIEVFGGSSFTAVSSSGATVAHGTYGDLAINADGTYTYTPNTAFDALQVRDHKTDVFTYQVTDASGLSATANLSFTINGADDTAIVGGGPFSGTVIEAGGVNNAILGTPTVSVHFAVTDVDGIGSVTVFAPQYGSFLSHNFDFGSTSVQFDVSYTLNNSNATVQALAAGAVLHDTIITQSSGVTQKIDITIVGANDAPVGVADSQTLNDTSAKDAGHAINGAASVLANDTDVDTGDTRSVSGIEVLGGSSFTAVSGTSATVAHGIYGDLAINADGTYTYTPNAAFDALQAGDQQTDVFTYQVTDAGGLSGTANLTFTINGANDPAVIAGQTTGAVVEAGGANNAVLGTATATGTLTDTDVDNSANAFQAVTTATASVNHYGTYTVDATGHWTYTLDNSNAAVQALNVGGQLTDSFAVLTADGTSQTVTVIINGANDAATFSGMDTGSVTEAGGVDNATPGTLSAGGTLIVTDVDSSNLVTAQNNVATGYGHFTIGTGGVWSYTLDNSNPTVQALNTASTPLQDVVTVTTADGTAHQITVAIHGADDAAVNTVPTSQTVSNAATLIFNSANGDAISVADVDNTTLTETLTVSHGTLTLNGINGLTFTGGDGTADQTMTFSGTQSAINTALNGLVYAPTSGYSGSDSLQITSNDGALNTTSTVAISVTQSNHAPVLGTTGVAGSVTGGASYSAGVNLIQNGGFEPLTLAGWTTAGTVFAGIDGYNSNSEVGFFSPSDATFATLSQKITTVVGTTYSIDFFQIWGQNLIVSANGVTLGSFANYNGTWTEYTYQFVATSTNTNIMFATNYQATLDQISVRSTTTGTAGTETVTGAISFTDQDSADTHTVTVAPVTVGYVGNFAAAVSPDATGGITGKVNWTFTAQDSDLAFIAKGASVQQSYTVTVDDGHGGKSAQNVVVTLVGGNHAPTAIADASNVNEDATASVTTRATGVLGNDTDPDTGDAATLTVSAILAGTTGTPTALSGGLASIAGTYGTLVMHSDGTYSYTPNGANAEALALGQQAQDVFTYTAQDSSGRAATTTLTFNITGQNDAPAITSGTTTGITEQAVQLASTSPDTKSGSLGFTDVDVNDTHTASVLSVTAAGVTAGLPSNAVLLGYLTTGAITESHGATGAIAWTFSAQDRTFDYLGASQTATLTYTVQVADNHGGTATQTVAVTITGTNDAAVVTGTTTGSVTEAGGVVNGTAGVPTATGTLTDTDVDGAANTFQAVTAATGSALGYGTYTIDATGHWTYNLSNGNAAVQALNAGGQLTDTFSVATQDGTAQTITVTINGADDAPVNTVPVAQNATSNQNFVFSSAKGDAISVSDVDNTSLTETLTVSHGTLTLSGLSGLTFTTGDGTADATMTFSGTQSAINAALNGLIYAPATNYSGSDSLQIASYDGSLTTTNTVGITVSANHAPVLAAVHAGETLSKLSSQNIGSTANALVLDGHLGLGVNANIMLDTTIPHVSISATGSGTLDYYKFTVTAGARGIFDIDSGLDTVINLLDSNGNKIASDDDSLITDGAGGSPLSSGSSTAHDSFLDYTFAAGGTYYLAVGVYGGNATIPSAIGSGSAYQLQVSLSSVATGPSFDGYTAGAGAPSGAVGTKVSSLVDLPGNGGRDNVTDSDAGAVTGIALSGTDTSHGTWWYSLNGSDWFMVGAVDDTHALLLAADANTRLYFQPAAGFNGSVSNAITFHAWDTTSGSAGTKIDASVNGGATAISTATVAAGLGVLGSPTVSISQSHASNTGTYKYTFNEAVIGFDQSDITYGNNITLTGGLIHVGLDASGHDVYTQAFSYAGSSASSHAATVGTGYTDLAGNTGTGSTTNFPAGVSGEPINLALTTPSSGHVGAISLSVAGVPAGWTLSEGTHNADGSWSVQTGDIGSLSISSPEGYTGALVLQVTESWTDGNGVAHNVYVSDNVEAYAKGAPIFAWSGDDTLTASSGNDMLVFTDRIGNDVVHHFDTAHDQIDLIGFAGVSSFADVQAHLANDAAGNARITLGDGETITLTGVDAGSLTAADFVFDQTPMTHNAGTLAIGDGALLPISGIVDNRGDIHLGSAGQETDLELVQHGVTLQGGGTVTLSDNDGNLIFGSDADVTLTNVDNTISGAGQIGGGQMTLVNEGSIIADGSHALLIDTGDNAVINTGLMEAAGSGGLVVHGNLSNDGMLWANGGNITVDGDVSGGGSARISGTGSLDIGGAFDERIVFDDGAAGTLKLDHAADFGGILSGFDHNDVLDLAGILGASATLSYAENAQGTGGVLSVTDGSHTANIAFSGQYAASDFHVAADSGNHALVQLEHQLQQLTAAA